MCHQSQAIVFSSFVHHLSIQTKMTPEQEGGFKWIIVKFSSDMITKNCITNNVLGNTDNVRILRVSMHCSCFPDSDDKRSVY